MYVTQLAQRFYSNQQHPSFPHIHLIHLKNDYRSSLADNPEDGEIETEEYSEKEDETSKYNKEEKEKDVRENHKGENFGPTIAWTVSREEIKKSLNIVFFEHFFVTNLLPLFLFP